jgi:hypothetical protein
MRILLAFSALTLSLSLTPASAMCGGMGGQQAQSSGQGAGMMCGRPAQSTQAEDPFGLKQSRPQQQQPQQQTGMICPCCKDMAGMMSGGMKMGGDDPHKGMDMSPKQ